MRKFWLVIKREYITRVKTKGFVIGTIAIPLFMIGMFALSIFLATRQTDHTLKVAILDNAGGLAATVTGGLSKKLPNGQPAFQVTKTLEHPESEEKARAELREEVSNAQIDGYLLIPRNITTGGSAEFHTKNAGDFTLSGAVESALNDAVIAQRLSEKGIHVDNLSEVVKGVDVKLVKVSKEGESEEKGQTFLVAIVAAMLLYMTLLMYGILTMRSILEEKTTRIVEVLISAVRPFQLLAGKVVGVAGVAFTQYLIWTVSSALVATYGVAVASSFGSNSSVPAIRIPTGLLVFLVVYFLLGYFLYASLYAAIGAACSNEQDAQQLQWPVAMPLILSFVMFNLVLRDPNSTASVVLSEIPFFAPIVMLLRIAIQTPPVWQIALSIFLLVLTTLGVVYVSSRIYRVGILMYGKRPSLMELLRWIRYT